MSSSNVTIMSTIISYNTRWWILTKDFIFEGFGSMAIALAVAKANGIVITNFNQLEGTAS